MTGVVIIDANLLVLLVVGSASVDYISKHKCCVSSRFTVDDFRLLGILVSNFSEIVLLPHVVAEVSNLSRQSLGDPARTRIQHAFRTLIMTTLELPIQSLHGAQRAESIELGITDAVMLHVCNMTFNDIRPTLITVDTALANAANSLGYSVIDYKQQFQDT